MRVLKVAKAHIGATVLGIAVIGSGIGVATAVVVTPAASTDEVYETPATTEPATTTVAPAPVATPEPVSDVVEAPADIVEPVTEPEQAPAVADEPAPAPDIPKGHRLPDAPPGQDMSGVGTIGPDGRYYSQQTGVDGLPTYVPDSGATAEPLPGEPDYVG